MMFEGKRFDRMHLAVSGHACKLYLYCQMPLCEIVETAFPVVSYQPVINQT